MKAGILMMKMMYPALSRMIQVQALSNSIKSYNGPWNLSFIIYLLSIVILFAVALLHFFVDIEEHRQQITVGCIMFHCKCLKMKCIRMLADATAADPSKPFLQLMNLLHWGQHNMEFKILLAFQAGMPRLLVHGSHARQKSKEMYTKNGG